MGVVVNGSGATRSLHRDGWVVYLGLGSVFVAAAWIIVKFQTVVVLSVLGGSVAGVIWLLWPELAIYLVVLACPYGMRFEVAGLDLRGHDVLIGTLLVFVGVVAANRKARLKRFKGPISSGVLILWSFIAVWGSIAFLMGSANQTLWSDPVRNTWYVYKEVFRPLLLMPLLAYALPEYVDLRRFINLILVACTGMATYAIYLSLRTGELATGSFDYGNQLAGFLVIVIPFAITCVFHESNWRITWVYVGVLLILVRALMLSGSRGGYVSLLASLGVIVLLLPRRKVVAAVLTCVLGIAVVFLMKSDLHERPMVQRFLTLRDPAQIETLQWREEQWWLFMERIRSRPMLGSGAVDDPALAKLGRLTTPHNGYLAAAAQAGIPAATAWIILLGMVGGVAVRRAWVAPNPESRRWWIGLSGALVALAVNNLVETNLQLFQIQQVFWILIALMIAAEKASENQDRLLSIA